MEPIILKLLIAQEIKTPEKELYFESSRYQTKKVGVESCYRPISKCVNLNLLINEVNE